MAIRGKAGPPTRASRALFALLKPAAVKPVQMKPVAPRRHLGRKNGSHFDAAAVTVVLLRSRCERLQEIRFAGVGYGAGDGNRTHASSLGSCSSTIELHPRDPRSLCRGSERWQRR